MKSRDFALRPGGSIAAGFREWSKQGRTHCQPAQRSVTSRESTGSLEKSRSFNFHPCGYYPPKIEVDTVSLDDYPEGPDQLRLRAATGYIELEMFEEANAELEEFDPFCWHFVLPQIYGRGRSNGYPRWSNWSANWRARISSKRAASR